MLSLEQKAWQLHENAVELGELHMIHQEHAWDFNNPNGVKNFTMDDAILVKWEKMFGNLQ